MSSVELRVLPRLAADNPLKLGKNSSAAPRRVALGGITNRPEAAVRTKGNNCQVNKHSITTVLQGSLHESQKPSKASCAQRGKGRKVKEQSSVVRLPAAAALPPPPSEADQSRGEERELSQAFSRVLLTVQDVDEQDGEQPQLCSQYVKEIYKYLHVLEVEQAVRADYMHGYEITPNMRALLVDWLVQVHSKFQLLQETLYLTVALLDRFLQVQPVSRRKLQLAGISAMLLACKYEEIFYPEVGDFAYITDNSFSKSQILLMEQLILKNLDFQLGRPLPLHFLRRASKVADSDAQKHTLAKYLMELTLLDYNMVHYRPSEVAAACLCLSQLLLDQLLWSPTQQHYSTYDEAHLKPIMQHVAKNLVLVNEGKTFQAVKSKYSSSNLLKISLLPELRSSTVRNMAHPLLSTS
ncbi:G2/mitotic-specific cyclin-B2 [Austrofundulus limnaeus]|uniref:G2/mitotic-specific cyclin-B2 n=1 Tax=Austrofundulus limnaeus TaxID=52670 RepID=A0A2I4CU30_AUSLI|nr:PREDICTED: G2/mitotic-specific cyclin-B2-like [Austrofundulus limnaeus]